MLKLMVKIKFKDVVKKTLLSLGKSKGQKTTAVDDGRILSLLKKHPFYNSW